MTDWKFAGETPPRAEEEWLAEFAKYKASPEFKAINRGMQLDDFKFIYWMEWAHRMWGRALGLVFVVPAVYFTARGAVKGPLAARLGLLGAMGGAQGLVGWWMVRSGLEEPTEAHASPRVSPYRLASHLASAFTIFGLLLWTTMSLSLPHQPSAPSVAAAGALRGLRRHALPLTGLIALTAASGAFVAGNDAGHAYNTFPLMNGHWIPEDYITLPGWRNAFESTGAVQLHHRGLAVTTLTATLAVWAAHSSRRALPKDVRRLLHALAAMAGLQVSLGISALLSYVPPALLDAKNMRSIL
ncbi:hypothetical protein WJX73_005348 [Symbiochloris irregularis]|uniref:Uncharacterized protein n=1 Tax=Symbiochloris irregularis TaxID=706552 RepID=A0AAW1PIM7_9CHLO